MLSKSSPSPSISFKARSITSLTYNAYRTDGSRIFLPSSTLPIQRRFASDETATQSKPEADGATEAQHGDNSIAASTDPETAANDPLQAEPSATQSNIDSATESRKETAESAADSAKESAASTTQSISNAASSAAETVTDAAQSLGAAAGFGSIGRDRERNAPTQDSEPSKTVYVGNLFFDVRAADLKSEFERAGPVVDAKIIMDNRGLSKGYDHVLPPLIHLTMCRG